MPPSRPAIRARTARPTSARPHLLGRVVAESVDQRRVLGDALGVGDGDLVDAQVEGDGPVVRVEVDGPERGQVDDRVPVQRRADRHRRLERAHLGRDPAEEGDPQRRADEGEQRHPQPGRPPVDAGRTVGRGTRGAPHGCHDGAHGATRGREPTGAGRLAPLRGAVPGRILVGPRPCAHPAMVAESGRAR